MSLNPLLRVFRAMASILRLASYPVLFAYFHNAGEAPLTQVWPPLGIFLGFAAGFFLLFSALARDPAMGAFATNIALVLFATYRPIEEFIRDVCWPIRYWHLVPVLFLTVLHMSWWLRSLDERRRKALARINRVAAGICTLLIVYNLAMAFPALMRSRQLARQARQTRGDNFSLNRSQADPFPNVYYILLDEYSSFEMILKHYDYDNSAFARSLESMGFSISYTSHNPSPSTPEILAHLIGMDPERVPAGFTADATGHMVRTHPATALYNQIKEESRLTRLFSAYGYEIHVADMFRLYYNSPVTIYSDHAYEAEPGAKVVSRQNTLHDITISRTPLYIVGQQNDTHLYNQMVNGILDWILFPRGSDQPVFLFAHIMCPHGPFMFDQHGRKVSGGLDWDNKDYYLGQFIYITDRISAVIRDLVDADPDCVIILQSDHSARMWLQGLPRLPIADMTSILKTVYFRGQPLNIEGLSGLDTGLAVYSQLFGEEFILGRDP